MSKQIYCDSYLTATIYAGPASEARNGERRRVQFNAYDNGESVEWTLPMEKAREMVRELSAALFPEEAEQLAALRAELAQAREEQRRGEEALLAALSLLEECQGALDYMEDRGYSSIRYLRSKVHTALEAALAPSPDASTREGER